MNRLTKYALCLLTSWGLMALGKQKGAMQTTEAPLDFPLVFKPDDKRDIGVASDKPGRFTVYPPADIERIECKVIYKEKSK